MVLKMPEPKTFKEFESYVKRKAYLYPITSTLLKKGEFYSNCTDDVAYETNRENIEKLWREYKSAPIVECVIGFKHYLAETVVSVEKFAEREAKSRIKEPVNYAAFIKLRDEVNAEYKKMGITDGANVGQACQIYHEVTNLLRKSTDPKKGCKMFSDALQRGKAVYAFKGPIIHKWKKDEKGHIMRDGCGDFMMDLNDELIFYSVLCAPHYILFSDKVLKADFRFIADTEVLDVAGDCKKRLEELLNEPSSRDKRRRYRKIYESKLPACYGIYVDEIQKIRELLKPEENEAVYLITADKGSGEDADDVMSFFWCYYDSLRRNLGKKSYSLLEIARHKLNNYKNLSYAKNMSKEKKKFINSRIKGKTDKFLIKVFSKQSHDKIPHSYIGSIIKSGELGTLMHMLGEELTDLGLKGFEIENVDAVQNKGYERQYFENTNDVAIIAKMIQEFLMILRNKVDAKHNFDDRHVA
jgi:hypothetical protein